MFPGAVYGFRASKWARAHESLLVVAGRHQHLAAHRVGGDVRPLLRRPSDPLAGRAHSRHLDARLLLLLLLRRGSERGRRKVGRNRGGGGGRRTSRRGGGRCWRSCG